MPELPDLVHIVKVLRPALAGRTIRGALVREPIVLRLLVPGSFPDLVAGRRFSSLERRGPFLHFVLEPGEAGGEALDLIMHLMLAGRLRLAPSSQKALAFTAFSLELEGGESLSYGDEKNMGKIYLCRPSQRREIPFFETQGLDLMGPGFTWEAFEALIAKKRCQARVFVMDQGSLSAIGNAYADEILFEAGIHPKASCSSLDPGRRRALYEAIRSVLAWGIEAVEEAGRPLEEKVRDHMRVRGRAGTPCPRCGATIRKAGVLGYDAFFCPVCQPDKAGKGLDWTKLPGPREGST
jgi:formamidopyrimidine-DNA glycosylase